MVQTASPLAQQASPEGATQASTPIEFTVGRRPPTRPRRSAREGRLDGVDAEEGFLTSVRTLEYEGKEQYCKPNGKCTSQKVTPSTAPGYDSMTGIGAPAGGMIAALAKG